MLGNTVRWKWKKPFTSGDKRGEKSDKANKMCSVAREEYSPQVVKGHGKIVTVGQRLKGNRDIWGNLSRGPASAKAPGRIRQAWWEEEEERAGVRESPPAGTL